MTYQTPELECYGTFRTLTQGGGSLYSDQATQLSNDGCVPLQNGGYTCLPTS